MRGFLIRIMQVLWILGAAALPFAVVIGIITNEGEAILVMLLSIFIWFIALAILQYLLFGKLSPLSSFYGGLDRDN